MDDVLAGFVKDRKTADHGAEHANRGDIGIGRATEGPDSPSRESDKEYPVDFAPSQRRAVPAMPAATAVAPRLVSVMGPRSPHGLRLSQIGAGHDCLPVPS